MSKGESHNKQQNTRPKTTDRQTWQSQQNTVKKQYYKHGANKCWKEKDREKQHKTENDRQTWQSAKHCIKQYYKHKANKCWREKGRNKQHNTRPKMTDRQTWQSQQNTVKKQYYKHKANKCQREKQQNTKRQTHMTNTDTLIHTPYKIIQAYMPLHPALSQWRRWPFSPTVFSAPAQPSPARYNLKPQRMLK